jgi:DNA gyrase inhibitor GyrI
MQLYRDFYTYTGHSVKEYIRKRRLSNALSMIKSSDMTLADIAYYCGYSSQQALCKYVKAATAMTPVAYKKSESYYYFPIYNNEPIRQVTVITETLPKTIHAKYYHPQLRGIENRAIKSLLCLLPEYRGRIFGKNAKQLNNQLCYELFVEYDDYILNKLKNSFFQQVSIEPEITLTFAKTTVKNEDKEIEIAWDYIYTNWLKNSMFIQEHPTYFEEYLHKSGQVKKLILYLPVKKRTDYTKISLERCEDQLFLVALRKGYAAEANASEAVMTFIKKNYPNIVKETTQFYLCKNGLSCSCGVKLQNSIVLPADSTVEILHLPKGNYAVLEGDCCSDSSLYEAILLSWINENGLNKDTFMAFTIYETNGSFEPEAIKMKLYIKLLEKC